MNYLTIFVAGAALAAIMSAGNPLASGAIPSERIVCDANAEGDVIEEVGQYGRVTAQTCHVGTFQGPEIRVFFVD